MLKYFTSLEKPKGLIGAKAQNLSCIIKSKELSNTIIVPKSLILPVEIYEKFIKDKDPKKETQVLPTELLEHIHKAIKQKFGQKRLIVRSSATCEDSIMFSFSGQYKSCLNIQTREQIEKALAITYNSFSSKNAQLYSEINSIDISKQGIAILIQEMAPVKLSGVLFTQNPVTGDKETIIEYVDGLGTKVVLGQEDVKQIVIKSSSEYQKDILWRKLYDIANKIEKILGAPQDIEWGTDNKNIYIFQSRPIFKDKKVLLSKKPPFKNIKKTISSQTISNGIEIGYLQDNPITTKEKSSGKILLQDKHLKADNIQEILNSTGIIITRGGLLSHFANIVREFEKPAIRINDVNELKPFKKELLILDAFTGDIYIWNTLKQKEKVFFIKKYFTNIVKNSNKLSKKTFGIKMIKKNVKYEQTFFDLSEENINKKIQSNKLVLKESYLQKIYTYGYPDLPLIEYQSYIRIQTFNKIFRVQYKTYKNIDNKYRKEYETLIYFKNLDSAKKFLRNRGLIQNGYQERLIEKYELDKETTLIKTSWPQAKPYLSIESSKKSLIDFSVKSLKLPNKVGQYTGGKEIFEKYNLKLNNLTFKNNEKKISNNN